jgi:S1-C subfamily serine protease
MRTTYSRRALFHALLAAIATVPATTTSLAQTSKAPDGTQHQELADVIKLCLSSVVSIEVRDASDKAIRTGSGFIASPDGKIVTNYHVVKGAHSAYVKLNNGAFFKVDGLIASDADADIAILKVAGNNLPVLPFGDSERAAVGQSVVAIGSPLGLENSVSNGIVSAVREDSGRKWIQTTAAASAGNSGGPLINSSGEVLGVVTWKLVGGENLNFAVPASSVKTLLGFAGSTVKPLDSGASSQFKFAPGQLVYIVSPNLELQRKAGEQFGKDRQFKPADGLRKADFVFVAIMDASSGRRGEELALVLLPDDYSQYRADLDGLRDHAVWRGGGPLRAYGSEVKKLVKQFEQEVLRLPEPKENW